MRAAARAPLQDSETVLVHEVDGHVDAFVTYGPSRDHDVPARAGEVYGLYVHPDSWRRGVGGSMLATALTSLRGDAVAAAGDLWPAGPGRPIDVGKVPVVLWTLEDNQRARRFHQGQGWIADGSSRRDQRPAIGAVPGVAFTEVRYRSAAAG